MTQEPDKTNMETPKPSAPAVGASPKLVDRENTKDCV
jgi:hypothetical protein